MEARTGIERAAGAAAAAGRKRLLFVSPRFLLPVDSGGKIRTTQILRGMHGGNYQIELVSPAPAALSGEHAQALAGMCTRFESWPERPRGALFGLTRMRHVAHRLPIPVRTDMDARAARLIARELATRPDVVVLDFLHAAVLAPPRLDVPSVLFTHNVEAEIFGRHAERQRNPLLRALWRSQQRKMAAFEREALGRFDVVVAVSERDAQTFREAYGRREVHVIPTGVDLDHFAYHEPERDGEVVFCGAMDWLANQDAVAFFMDEVWPLVTREVPQARMCVVGKAPPRALVARARERGLDWSFTGWVEDVRPHVRGAAAAVIPLRIGGGTRLKAYEAMAMGTPLVSTTIGVEGLPLRAGEHYLRADSAAELAAAVVALLREPGLRRRIARAARSHVEARFSFREAAAAFEAGCELARARGPASRPQRPKTG